MAKIIMRHIPSKIEKSTQHKVMKSWSMAMIETYAPKNNVEIISIRRSAKNTCSVNTKK